MVHTPISTQGSAKALAVRLWNTLWSVKACVPVFARMGCSWITIPKNANPHVPMGLLNRHRATVLRDVLGLPILTAIPTPMESKLASINARHSLRTSILTIVQTCAYKHVLIQCTLTPSLETVSYSALKAFTQKILTEPAAPLATRLNLLIT